jgi:phytol kinase
LITASILLLGEFLWRKHILKGEFARKFIHISAASVAAFWPYFISRYYIVALSLFFVVSLFAIKKLKLFKSLHSIQRATYGEIWYALSIGIIALVFQDDIIYTIAVLHMALADGFAAVVGVGLNHKAGKFRFLGAKKSIAGTLTFILLSFSLNIVYWTFASHYSLTSLYVSPVIYSFLSSLILAYAEIVAPHGSDNVIIPLLSGILLWMPTAMAGAV